MNETHFDWDDLHLFLAVAREGGLAAATSSTGKSAPTLGRRMLALERKLGQELFERLPRGYALTRQGRDLLVKVGAIEKQITPITDQKPSDPLIKISAGAWVTHFLCQRVAGLIGQDRVSLRFISSDHVLDIGRREAVIGIRNHRPEQIGLAGRRIAKVRFAIYATDSDVATWARVIGTTPSARWLDQKTKGEPSIEVTNPRNALDLAIAGSVRAVLPTFIGDAQNELKRVTPPIGELEHDQWLVTHHEDRYIPEVRKTIDRIYAMLKKAQNQG